MSYDDVIWGLDMENSSFQFEDVVILTDSLQNTFSSYSLF